MSSGGTKSVLHSDDLDNINCLFRGSKELLFINPVKYQGKVCVCDIKARYVYVTNILFKGKLSPENFLLIKTF